MGAVLAMRRRRLSLISALVAAAALAGCTNDPSGIGPQRELREVVGRFVAERTGQPAPGNRSIDELTRAAIAGRTRPLILARVPSTDSAATMGLTAVNNGVQSWQSGTEATVMLDGPVLFATRGLGLDLLSAETAGLAAALASGRPGERSRTYRYLDELSEIVAVRYQCRLSVAGPETITVLERRHATTRYAETCRGPGGTTIRNEFWLGADGTPWRTRQWIGPGLGYLGTERLIR